MSCGSPSQTAYSPWKVIDSSRAALCFMSYSCRVCTSISCLGHVKWTRVYKFPRDLTLLLKDGFQGMGNISIILQDGCKDDK